MRQLILILSALLISSSFAWSQEVTIENDESVIYLDSKGANTVSANDGKLSLMLNGTRFNIGQSKKQEETTGTTSISRSPRKAYFGLFGIGSPHFNHIAAFEIGVNTFVGTDYSMYSAEEANQLMYSNKKAVNFTFNVGNFNVPLNPRRSLVLSGAFGFTYDNYTFVDNYTMEYRDGMMHSVALDGNIKKSKMVATYFHMPVMIDLNLGKNFFISAGVNLDVLIGSHLKYKFPKTTIDDTITLNPVQFGITGRVGWRRLYGYVNYSFIDMYKKGTGPGGKRLSAGVGVWF